MLVIPNDIQYRIISTSKEDETDWCYHTVWSTLKAASYVADELNAGIGGDPGRYYYVSALSFSDELNHCFAGKRPVAAN